MACKVKVNRHGYLAFRLYWNGIKAWEGTGLKGNSKNRQRVEARAVLISEEMERGTFDYLKWFPNGNKAHLFRSAPTMPNVDATQKTVQQYYEEWIKGKKPPLVRKSRERDYRQAFNKHILPFLGDIPVGQITPRKLEDFRIYLLEQAKLSLKSARNIIDAYLRAMMRDARNVDHLISKDPFAALEWKKQPKEEPDPFTEEERDKILEFYRETRPYKAYVFVHNQFWTGMRPSEATALRRGKVDLTSGKAMIVRSRHLGEEEAPKTRASRRTVKLSPNVVELLDTITPLHQTPDDYIYTDEHGRPIDQAEFGRGFQGVLRVLNIRPRPFYNTRHTYISVALTLGCKIKWVAEQCGTSVAMIEENYGKYIGSDGDAPILAYLSRIEETQQEGQNEEKSETFGETFSSEGANYAGFMVVPTGFEPVLPT